MTLSNKLSLCIPSMLEVFCRVPNRPALREKCKFMGATKFKVLNILVELLGTSEYLWMMPKSMHLYPNVIIILPKDMQQRISESLFGDVEFQWVLLICHPNKISCSLLNRNSIAYFSLIHCFYKESIAYAYLFLHSILSCIFSSFKWTLIYSPVNIHYLIKRKALKSMAICSQI